MPLTPIYINGDVTNIMEATVPGTESYRERKVATQDSNSRELSLPGVKWPDPFAPENESSCYLSLPVTFGPWNSGFHNVCHITVYVNWR